jgi:cyanophycinase
VAAALALAAAAPASATDKLVLLGGGERPKLALSRFVDWAGGQVGSRVLVAAWGGADPRESLESLRADLLPWKPEVLEAAPPLPLTPAGRTTFLAQLRRATGFLVGGGDTVRIMETLRDPEVFALLRERRQAGLVLAGSSAGMAILAEQVIEGEADLGALDGPKGGLRPGLGLLRGAVLEPHFVKDRRANRLVGLVLAHPDERGIGVDEGTALLVEDGVRAEVVGASVVTLVDRGAEKGSVLLTLVRAGSVFEIARR